MDDGRLAALRRGEQPPELLAETASGFAVFGDHPPGRCVLVHRADVEQLDDLDPPDRGLFLTDLALLGQAVRTALRDDPGFRRVDYEIVGDGWPHLHGHVTPRYGGEQPAVGEELRGRIALELRALLIGG